MSPTRSKRQRRQTRYKQQQAWVRQGPVATDTVHNKGQYSCTGQYNHLALDFRSPAYTSNNQA
eukprot:10139981-Prorocentrum_lima.AAC.1